MADRQDDFEKEEQAYQALLKDTKKELNDIAYSQEEQRKIINRGKSAARTTNVLVSLAILLLIVPVMTLLTYMYYSFGSKADRLIDVTGKTIYVTEPNMSIEEMEIEHEISFFSMDIVFDVYKRIGREDFNVGNYSIYFALDEPDFPTRKMLLERPFPDIPSAETERLFHPDATLPSIQKDWDILNRLPEGTVSEIYLSFSELMSKKEVESAIPGDLEVRWLAVDTGLEARQVDKDGVPITPLGYPAQIDSTTWSPFNGQDGMNEEVFLDILSLLEENEEIATKVARAKSLALSSRIQHVKENGISFYGAVVTGPSADLAKLKDSPEFRMMKIGEVKLWNWR